MAEFSVRMNMKAALDEIGVDGFTISRRYLVGVGEAAKVFARQRARQVLKVDTPNEDRRNPDARHYIDAFTARTVRRGQVVVLAVGNTHPATNIIELGQAAHEIGPKDAQQLAWPGSRSKDGLDHIIGIGIPVNHPGAPGYHILASSLRSAAQKQRRIARIG